MAIREGRWDCPSCGSTGIYGRHTDCPGCGKPRPAGVRFYLAHGEPDVKDPEQLRDARAGADWICQQCKATNRAAEARCAGCGAFRGSRNPLQKVHEYTTETTPRTGDAARPASAAPGASSGGSGGSGGGYGGRAASGSSWPRRLIGTRGAEMPLRRRIGWTIAGVMGFVVLVGMVREAIPERTPGLVPGVVEAATWVRIIHLAQRSMVNGEGWELPENATVLTETRRVREHRQEVAGYQMVTRLVPRTERVVQGYREETRTYEEQGRQTGTRTWVCGSKDLGNGYFEDVECSEPEYETVTHTERVSVPIYKSVTTVDTVREQQPIYRTVPVEATWYTWRAPRWERSEPVQLNGTWMIPPEWPALPADTTRRESWRYENYSVGVRDRDGQRWNVYMEEEAEFRKFRPGQRVALGLAGGRRSRDQVLSPDSLRACRRWHAGRGGTPPQSLGCSPRPARARR